VQVHVHVFKSVELFDKSITLFISSVYTSQYLLSTMTNVHAVITTVAYKFAILVETFRAICNTKLTLLLTAIRLTLS